MLRQRFYLCLKFSLDFVATYSCWLRHIAAGCDIVLLAYLKLCRDIQKTMSRQRLLHFLFFASFLLVFSHKVGEYSIIWHENRSETVKNMPEKWIKNICV